MKNIFFFIIANITSFGNCFRPKTGRFLRLFEYVRTTEPVSKIMAIFATATVK